MAISPNQNSRPNSRTSESNSPMRRSFSGNPIQRPSIQFRERIKFVPATPSNSPAEFVRTNSSGKEEKENEKDTETLKPAKARSPAVSKGLNHFMEPTILAASKINPSPRKKVLANRNGTFRTSLSFFEGKSLPDSANIPDFTEDFDQKPVKGFDSKPPFFNGSNYTYWKARMKIFLTAYDIETLKCITYGYVHPKKENESKETILKELKDFTPDESRACQTNAKAMNALICAIDATEYNKISLCSSAKEIWDKLEVIYEGTKQVREIRINMLVHDYELFRMKENESISDMYSRFTILINDLTALGKMYSMKEKVMKILRCLPQAWHEKVTAILEARDLEKFTLDELVGSLITHEMIIAKDDEQEVRNKRNKGIALKSTIPEESKNESSDDEDIALFARRFNKFVKWNKKGGRKFHLKDFST